MFEMSFKIDAVYDFSHKAIVSSFLGSDNQKCVIDKI